MRRLSVPPRGRWRPLVVLVVMVTTGTVALVPSGAAAPGAAASPVRAPVLSARRVPALVSRLVADARLRTAVDSALAGPALGAGRERSCMVVRQGRRTILSRRPDERLIPASNLKVLTGLAALARLGPDETLVTQVRVDSPVGAGGVVEGPLWLVGGGDPLLATTDYVASLPNQPQLSTSLEALADDVVKAGIRHVRGGVLGDETRYDRQRYIPTWRQVYITDSESGPASALAVNDGFAQFSPKKVAAAEPDVHAAAVLTALLRARGVVVDGGPGEGQAAQGAPVLAEIRSLPVRLLVGQMLRESDNLTAELLVKELGQRFAGAGTTVAGLGVLRETLASASLPVEHLTTVDGSGLDRSDRASCTLLMAALQSARSDGHLAAGFPVAGRDGTLAKRFQGNPAAGRLRAKTGALAEVAALTGYVDSTAGGPPLAFAFLINGLPRDALGRALQEQLGALLASYPEAPAPDLLAP
ncbi:MAG TPA: D-alanyl-D-alanine carboxypeptidase/D-alanyl-D-alanine-endopeptidase [Acidimicrobiales bacterium]|nr:D-alanyl-D-alanine carboxypeptidase/D-alanyl-D-alanine-endopeptidase [Acidimicrobiales bacterium]